MADVLVYIWRKIGKLKILFDGNQSACIRFTPSKEAVDEGFARAQGRTKGRGYNEGNNQPLL